MIKNKVFLQEVFFGSENFGNSSGHKKISESKQQQSTRISKLDVTKKEVSIGAYFLSIQRRLSSIFIILYAP